MAATAACSCGRLRFAEVPDGAPSTPTCDWSSGPPFTGPPMYRPDLSSLMSEFDPFLAPGDPLTMHFGSNRTGDTDVFRATRPSIDAPFDQIVRVDELSSVGTGETGLILDATQSTGYYTKAQKIHAVVRDVPGGPLRDAGPVSELAISNVYQDAWPSPDGLSLTFSTDLSTSQIYTASRSSRDEPWANIMPSSINIPGVNAGGATLTADQRVMVWTREGAGRIDLYYTVRDDPSVPFVGGALLFGASAPGIDFEGSIREDGCELFFGRSVGTNNFDIYSLVATP